MGGKRTLLPGCDRDARFVPTIVLCVGQGGCCRNLHQVVLRWCVVMPEPVRDTGSTVYDSS